jgi:hypothetical protein
MSYDYIYCLDCPSVIHWGLDLVRLVHLCSYLRMFNCVFLLWENSVHINLGDTKISNWW